MAKSPSMKFLNLNESFSLILKLVKQNTLLLLLLYIYENG